LILINIVYYILRQFELVPFLGIIRFRGELYHWYTAVTYSITHTRFEHLFWNLWFTAGFVGVYEYKFGTKRTVIVYYVATILAGLAYVWWAPYRLLNITQGASAGWYAMMGALLINWKQLGRKWVFALIVITLLCVHDTFTATNINVISHVAGYIIGVMYGYVPNKHKEERYETSPNKRQRHTLNRNP
jgi:rhomboid protease GluP